MQHLGKKDQLIMIIVAIIIIITFSMWGGYRGDKNQGQRLANGADILMELDGKNINRNEVERCLRQSTMMQYMGMRSLGGFLSSVNGNDNNQDNEQTQLRFASNIIILKQQLEKIGIFISDEEAKEAYQNNPMFQENGKFNKENAERLEQLLQSQGFLPADILELIKLDLGFDKLQNLVSNNYDASKLEGDQAYAYAHTNVKLAQVKFDINQFKKQVKIEEDSIKKAYEEKKSELLSQPKRAISYIHFADAQNLDKIPLEERQKLTDSQLQRVDQFNQDSMADNAKFTDIANKYKETIITTEPFTQDSPPATLKDEPELLTAIFKQSLNSANISDPIDGANGYYIFTITQDIPAAPLSYEQAKDSIVTQLTGLRALEALTEAVNRFTAATTEGFKSGQTFENIAKAQGLEVTILNELNVRAANTSVPFANELLNAKVVLLPPNTISKPIETPEGTLIVSPIEKKLYKSEQSLSLRENSENNATSGSRMMLMMLWFNDKAEQAKINFLTNKIK
jgi:hypothetical protein